MTELIGAGLEFAAKLIEHFNIKEANKHKDRIRDLQKDLLEERTKPYADRDDAKIESLWKEMQIEQQAMHNQILLSLVTKR